MAYLLLVLLSLLSVDLAAQFPGSRSSGGSGQSLPSDKDTSRDTLSKAVLIYLADNSEVKRRFEDSSMLNFHLYDPIRQTKYEYAHLGNLGSAHRQLVFQQRFHKGFDAGFHSYDLYLTKPTDIPYYELEKAYSDIYFSQTNQEKTSFNANFSKPIGKNMYLSIYYKNIRNEGQYVNQAARTNSFSGAINFKSKNNKYQGYLSFTTNTVEQKENGGGLIDSLGVIDATFLKSITPPVGRPVNTNTGESRYFERDINYTHFYLLQKSTKTKKNEPTKEDSLRAVVTQISKPTTNNQQSTIKKEPAPKRENTTSPIPAKPGRRPIKDNLKPTGNSSRYIGTIRNSQSEIGRKFTLKHNLSLRRNTYKYLDATNLTYYGDFKTDDRGIRNYIETNQIENSFSIRTFKLGNEKKRSLVNSSKKENATQKDLLEAGITHIYTKINQEPIDSNLHNIFIFGKMDFTPTDRLSIKSYYHFGFGKQAGDYYLKGDFLWDTKKLGKIKFSLTNQLYSPSLLQQRFIVTQQDIWQNNFNKILENSLTASYAIPKLKIELTANYHLINNYIYYDSFARPKQLSGSLNIFQLMAKNQIDAGIFHLQNTVYFQHSTSDKMRFPDIYSIHRLYLDLKLFKVMKTQLGGEVRLNTPYKPDNFQPLTAQFFLQETEIPFYPLIDVFFNFRIQQFRFFIIMENLYSYATPDFHYTTYSYPVFDPKIRFGFRWLFLD